MLRPKQTSDNAAKALEILARIATRSSHRGPVVSIEEMDEAVQAAVAERYKRSQ